MAHALDGGGVGGGAEEVPLLAEGVGAADEEVRGGGDAAVSGAAGEDGDVAGADGDFTAAREFAAEDELGFAGGEGEDLVRGGVVVMEGVDAVAPGGLPAVAADELFKALCEFALAAEELAIEEDGQALVVGHPPVFLEEKRFGLWFGGLGGVEGE